MASLFIFKWTSNPGKVEKIESSKRGIWSAIFEIRLFNDDLLAILRATADMFVYNFKYAVALLLVPLLWMIVPFTLAYFHIDPYFHHRALDVGESAVVRVEVGEALTAERPDLRLEAPAGLTIETAGVWVPTEREMSWRIRAETAGEYELEVHHPGGTSTKTVSVSDELVRRSDVRPGTDFFAQLEDPSEPPLAAESGLRAIELSYDDDSPVLWVVVWIVLMLVFALAMKDLVGVTM